MSNVKMKPVHIALLISTTIFIVYSLSSNGEGNVYNYFVLLSDAFLHGRVNILIDTPWLNELVSFQGKFYTVFPPMPAILMLPAVAIFGTNFYQPILSIFLGTLNVFISYFVFLKLFQSKNTALWLSILNGFGTIQWYHASVGSAWYVAHIVALFFLWLAILETVSRQRLFLIGLLLGGAYLSRIPTILGAFFVLFFLHHKFFNFSDKKLKINFKSCLLFGAGFLPAILFNGLYNFFRYGVFYDIGYTLLPILNEPWYRNGFISYKYIPLHLFEMLFSPPVITPSLPFIIPNLFAMSVLLITPAFFLIFFAQWKKKLVLASAIGALTIALPSLMHGGNGFTQFGYRHILDYLPFLLILTASGFHKKPFFWAKLLIILSILINLWGVVMISFLKIWVI